MAVLGGFANFFGPIVGALTYILLQDQLQSLTEYWRFMLGAILALIVIGLPGGHRRARRRLCAGAWRGRRHDARCSRPAASARPTAPSARSTTSAWRCTRASSSRSSARTAPARPRWSTCSPGCWRRPQARCCSWASNIAGVGPVELADRGMARAFQLIQIFPKLTVAETIAAAVVSRQKKRWRLFSRSSATMRSQRARARSGRDFRA